MNQIDANYRGLFRYFLELTMVDAIDLKKEQLIGNEFEMGYRKGQLFSFFQIFSLIKSQCSFFGITENDLDLDNFDEYDLLLKDS